MGLAVRNTIVIWGAGRIGRGFVADLFAAAGWRLVLVDRSAALVDALRRAGRYTVVRAESAARRTDRVIDGYEALDTAQSEQIAAAVADADLLAVAVFPGDFPAVAEGLAPGLMRRRATRPTAPLDILLCANLSHAAQHFRSALRAALPAEMLPYADEQVGLVETLVIRMVADAPPALAEAEPLLVWTNGLARFPVDRRAFKGRLPQAPGLELIEDMQAEETRKLYTYNMCHAALAYLGARKGHRLTVECLADPVVRRDVEAALGETSVALQAEYGFRAGEMEAWVRGVLEQTDNSTLNDRVARHGADPLRKLRRADRLVGPALLARKHGIRPVHLARAIAAGFMFDAEGDAGARAIRQQVASLGLRAAVRAVCELAPEEDDLAEMIVAAYEELA